LGTGYPVRWQPKIGPMLANSVGAAWARCLHLLHGVAVAAPTEWATAMMARPRTHTPYDQHLSRWALLRMRPVFYTLPSMVDHADGPSLVTHPEGPRTASRHAWMVGVPDWNGHTVEL
jgi:hypothetical protein